MTLICRVNLDDARCRELKSWFLPHIESVVTYDWLQLFTSKMLNDIRLMIVILLYCQLNVFCQSILIISFFSTLTALTVL